MTDPTLRLDRLQFSYTRQGPWVIDIDHLEIAARERVFLKGASGSGKSTLLGLISGILSPKNGKIDFSGYDLASLSAAKRDEVRATHMGVIFQLFNLLPYMPVGENIVLPCHFSKARAQACAEQGGAVKEGQRILQRLGLDPAQYWTAKTSALSVGQQQRVAAARALIGRPNLVLADEPTSALDSDSRDAFIQLIQDECEQSGAALLFVSHDASLAHHFDRTLNLTEINRSAS